MRMIDPALWLNMGVALGIGLLLGAERERDQSRVNDHPIGIRTFALASLLGLVSAFFHFWLLVLAILSVVALVCMAYFLQNQAAQLAQKQLGMTTEMALIFAVYLGGLCVNEPALAAIIAILIVSLLASKTSLHHFVRETMTQAELNQLLLLATASLIIYPLLPNRWLGPFHAINLSVLWGIVIIVMALSAASHVCMRVMGSRIGLPVTGLLSGFISSIATISSMAHLAKSNPLVLQGTIAAAIWSSLATVLQLVLILSVMDAQTLWAMRFPLAVGGFAIAGMAMVYTLRGWQSLAFTTPLPANNAPLEAALTLAGLVALVSLLTAAIQHYVGVIGFYGINALAGLLDVHAPTIAVASLVSQGQLSPDRAAFTILLAFSMNALSKLAMAYLSRLRVFYQPLMLAISVQVLLMWLSWFVFL